MGNLWISLKTGQNRRILFFLNGIVLGYWLTGIEKTISVNKEAFQASSSLKFSKKFTPLPSKKDGQSMGWCQQDI